MHQTTRSGSTFSKGIYHPGKSQLRINEIKVSAPTKTINMRKSPVITIGNPERVPVPTEVIYEMETPPPEPRIIIDNPTELAGAAIKLLLILLREDDIKGEEANGHNEYLDCLKMAVGR